MKMKKIQKGALIVIGALAVIMLIQIAVKLARSSARPAENIVTVGAVIAQAKEIDETVVNRGIAEGDPQVKVYTTVPGKFERAAVKEGTVVKKDDTIFYINRDVVGMDFQLVPVKSPINGIVTRIYFSDKGAMVSPQYPAAEVSNPAEIKVIMQTGEEDMVKVKNGMAADINPVYGGGGVLKGTVYSSTPFIDTDTMSGTIIVKAPNMGNSLKPGMSVEVIIHTDKRRAIMIPESAVLMGEGKTYVFINDSGKAKRVDVKTGYMAENETEIVEGIPEGAQIINEGNFKLNEGSKLNIKL
jgi:multidrug efflux pump subunit AcrA (membrane-fusion protein)